MGHIPHLFSFLYFCDDSTDTLRYSVFLCIVIISHHKNISHFLHHFSYYLDSSNFFFCFYKSYPTKYPIIQLANVEGIMSVEMASIYIYKVPRSDLISYSILHKPCIPSCCSACGAWFLQPSPPPPSPPPLSSWRGPCPGLGNPRKPGPQQAPTSHPAALPGSAGVSLALGSVRTACAHARTLLWPLSAALKASQKG